MSFTERYGLLPARIIFVEKVMFCVMNKSLNKILPTKESWRVMCRLLSKKEEKESRQLEIPVVL
jgi:hypothetical protein